MPEISIQIGLERATVTDSDAEILKGAYGSHAGDIERGLSADFQARVVALVQKQRADLKAQVDAHWASAPDDKKAIVASLFAADPNKQAAAIVAMQDALK